MMAAHRPLYGTHAREIERLLGLERWSLYSVDRGANGGYRLRFRYQQIDYRWRRALKIPRSRILGYTPRTPWINEPTRQARVRQNKRSFARWLWWRVGMDVPAAAGWRHDGDLDTIDRLRAAIILLASPATEAVPQEWEAA
jgi:hypothetical protein